MKSTHKLFGTVWDGIEDSNPVIADDCERQVVTSTVSLSDLLCASIEDDVAKLLEPFRDSDTIAIDMDYIVENENPVIKAFIKKRERQIIGYLSEKFKVVYCCRNTKIIPSGATNA